MFTSNSKDEEYKFGSALQCDTTYDLASRQFGKLATMVRAVHGAFVLRLDATASYECMPPLLNVSHLSVWFYPI
jgi:hypothetical protein